MLLLLLVIICAAVIFYLTAIKPYRHWTNRGVKQFSVMKIWVEHCKTIFQLSPVAENLKKMYSAFSEDRYCGVYQLMNPLLLLKDPELIKQITVKDFDHFMDHNQFITEDMDSLWGKNLFSLKGDRWRDMRTTLSPSFTSSKMKIMFDLMCECAENFVEFFKGSETVTVELKDAFTRYTNDVIASVAFGITCDSLRNRDNEFYVMGRSASNLAGLWRNFTFIIMIFFPKIASYLGLYMFNKQVSTFFRKLVKENIESREKSGIVRPDMIHLLMEAKNDRLRQIQEQSLLKRQLTNDDLTAQALIFFFAGFESVSILMCFTAYELAVDPLIQQNLQNEVDNALEECMGKITYEALQKMEYLDMVLSEALRKWPSAIAVDRVCVKPYTIQPEKVGEKPLELINGDILWIPIIAIHYDEKFYSEPNRFVPERFSVENRANITPYSYIPFGAGPRNCIGNRFALLETKILFINILKDFDIVVVDKSVVPIKLSQKQFNLTSATGFWFGFKPREKSI